MPKDIRAFFGSGAKRPAPSGTKPDDDDHGKKALKEEPPSKKTKVADKAASPVNSKEQKPKQASTPKSAAKRSNAAAARASGASGGGKRPSRGAAKKAIVIDDDDNDDFGGDESDSDVEVVYEGSDSDAEADFADLDKEDEAQEHMVQPKKRARASTASQAAAAAAAAEPVKPAAEKPKTPASGRKKLPSSMKSPSAASSQPTAAATAAKPVTTYNRHKSQSGAAAQMSESAQKAIAAVDAAVKKLPADDELNFTQMEAAAGGFGGGGNQESAPPNHGAKPAPRGHEECLTGKTFVISGVLDSLYRHEAEDLIKRHNGKVTGSVSGRTSFLLVGENCGASKMRTAKEKGTKLIDEDGLFSLINASVPFADAPGAHADGDDAMDVDVKPQQPAAATAAAAKVVANGNAASQLPSSSAAAAAVPRLQANEGGQLWVDKYKPSGPMELIGHGDKVNLLRQWLQQWEAVHLHGAAVQQVGSGRGKPKDLSKRAVLISGAPGIGKTTAALVVSRECGYHAVEMNASDTRNKADKAVRGGMAGKTANMIKELTTNTAIALPGQQGHRKQVLIMDEVDGMSGSDRGGVADLIQTIHKSKMPIICICNDKYSQKLRSLRNHCLELEFNKPNKLAVAKRMVDICRKEGLDVQQQAVEALVEMCNGDLRTIIGQLQMIRLRATRLSYDDVKGRLKVNKDVDMSPFECARQLLDSMSSQLTIADRMDLVFQDADLIPLLVQENYLNHIPSITNNDLARLKCIAKAADAFSAGDVVNRRVRQYQAWNLMPFAVFSGTVFPATYMRGRRETFGLYPGEMNFPRFSAWLGNQSSTNKQKRLLTEVTTRMHASGAAETTNAAVRQHYLPVLRHLLVKPLLTDEEHGIERVVDTMTSYCLAKEEFEYIMDVTHFKSKQPWNEDLYKDVPTKVKSAFTRAINSADVKPRSSLQVEEFKVGRGGRKSKGKAAAADGGAAEDGVEGMDGVEENAEEAAPDNEEKEDEQEMENIDAQQLASKFAKRGVQVQLKQGEKKSGRASKAAGASGKKASTSKAASGGRGGKASGRGASQRGSASGRGSKAR